MKKTILLGLALLSCSLTALGADQDFKRFYAGLAYGYGSTNWDQLTVSDPNSDAAETTPIGAEAAGADKGIFFGYYIMPNFAVEASYHKYHDAYIHFQDEFSVYADTSNVNFTSKTKSYSLVAKFIVPFTSNFNGFADAGAVKIYRSDPIAQLERVSATFGVGMNYYIGNHVIATVEGDYAAGYGKSEVYPVDSYVPFLYNVDFKLAYRF